MLTIYSVTNKRSEYEKVYISPHNAVHTNGVGKRNELRTGSSAGVVPYR